MRIRLIPVLIFLAVIVMSLRIGRIWDSLGDGAAEGPKPGEAVDRPPKVLLLEEGAQETASAASSVPTPLPGFGIRCRSSSTTSPI